MATAIPLPKLGNTVESTILVGWRKNVGDTIRIGETLCDVETDKATMEVESPAEGTILSLLYQPGDEIPVLVNIAVVGAPGEDVPGLPFTVTPSQPFPASREGLSDGLTSPLRIRGEGLNETPANIQPIQAGELTQLRVSPRARNLAARKSLTLNGLQGSGPRGRVTERDVLAALQTGARLTPVAQSMVAAGDFMPPERGTGAGGRITKKDLIPAQTQPEPTPSTEAVEIISLKGARKIIAARMLESLQTTAQLTLNTSTDARALLDYRKRLKNSAPELGLQKVTINDLVLFAVSRTLTQFPDLNSLFQENAIHRYQAVHLGMAVDTERGLLVPVIRQAQTLSLKVLADEAHRLAEACVGGQIKPDELTGGTFSVSNLGNLGIESFTPVLNPPQVGILGVGGINLKPVEEEGEVKFIPHISLSLTINHQVVDGAPGARFLQALSRHLGQIDVLVSV